MVYLLYIRIIGGIMKLIIADKEKLNFFKLPEKVEDSFLITYHSILDDEEKNINIQAENNLWYIQSNDNTKIIENGEKKEAIALANDKVFQITFIDNEEQVFVICLSENQSFLDYATNNMEQISIGSSMMDHISFQQSGILESQVLLKKEKNQWILSSKEGAPVYINKKRYQTKVLQIGDEIFLLGLKLIWLNSFFRIQKKEGKIKINQLIPISLQREDNHNYEKVTNKEKKALLYKENEYFFHTPSLKPILETAEIEIENPPAKERDRQLPLILTVGSSLVMALVSLATCAFSFISIKNGTSTWQAESLSIIIGISLFIGSVLFPVATYYYEKHIMKKREEKRQQKYSKYLEEKRQKIVSVLQQQTNILKQLYLDCNDCQKLILTNQSNLWDHEIQDNDFLTIRLGKGKRKANLNIIYTKERFSIDEDNLQEEANKLIHSDLSMPDVPITVSLIEYPVFPIILNTKYKKEYIYGILMQLMAYYSSSDLKLVFLINEKNVSLWEPFKYLAHSLDDQGKIRLFGYSEEDLKNISNYLEEKLNERIKFKKDLPVDSDLNKIENVKENYKLFSSYYLIITDHILEIKNLSIMEKLLQTNANYGFSILMFENAIKNLPSRCNYFSNISDHDAGLFSKNISSNSQNIFTPEFLKEKTILPSIMKVANIPVGNEDENSTLPQTLEFLEMYKVGKIEQLNIKGRWMDHNPTLSLSAPVGVHPNGNLFELDLHEKAHGPHGLIAGSTGSGKSEFIITYILSMCINYSPKEVQFVLIDYKGGGLAGAFENREKGTKIPHLVGTITNLDTSEMNRTLVSIRSELNRRQALFNQIKNELGESTIDIYKYQRFYREGLIQEPIAHLFIISDEFAELKSQQPDFMNELISTARIGRSLGVHLILATQKPSGVVDDQIWSNTRFKVCLKVQSEADSQEMLRKPDAASLKETGRFYLQVGYDEVYEIGQSAWSGAKYIPTDLIEKKVDDSINFISNSGTIIKSINDTIKKEDLLERGEQLTNLVKYLTQISIKEQLYPRPLWLPSLPKEIYLNNLIEKYHFQTKPYEFISIIGEYDEPENQKQDILTLNLTESGNILLYGITGSGKENQIMTMLYSLCLYHHPQEINIYIMDFGAEVLKVMGKMPQVGDYVTTYENDKIYNLLQMTEKEFHRRKQILSEFGGNFDAYNKKEAQKLPLMFIIINNYESFIENYGNLEDSFNRLFRESSKTGIIFLITALAGNSLTTRVSQNFSTIYALRFNDDYEYRFLLDAPATLVPKKTFGRGLTKVNGKPLEYQSAYITIFDQINDTVKEIAIRLTNYYKVKARAIPTIPSKISFDTLKQYVTDLTKVPIGVNLEDISIATYDFLNPKITPVIGNDIQISSEFLSDFYKMISSVPNTIVLMLDFFLTIKIPEKIASTTDPEEFIPTLEKVMKKEDQPSEHRIVILTGIADFFDNSMYEEELKDRLRALLENSQNYPNTSFILIDEYQKFRDVTFEKWYQKNNNNSGLWIGEGIENQIIYALKENPRNETKELTNNIGYLITNGESTCIKGIAGDE